MCRSLDFDLAATSSAAENSWCAATAKELVEGPWWFGINDVKLEGIYVWSSGEPVSFTKWALGEPEGGGQEDCGRIGPWEGAVWHLDKCDDELPFICEDPDTDGDGVSNKIDTDDDGDGIPDIEDICPLVPVPEMGDLDQDGIGDMCDSDLDGDGVENGEDNCPETSNGNQLDVDEDQMGDQCDEDADDDGVKNDFDVFWLDENEWADTDCDGVGNNSDPEPTDPTIPEADLTECEGVDTDKDDIPDVCDFDDDGDGVCDAIDIEPLVPGQDDDDDGFAIPVDCDDDNAGVNPAAEDICDGLDNDCDGAIDAGIDLLTDPMNCGQCDEICGPYIHVKQVGCDKGECYIKECADGYADDDLVVETGCELMTATGELWVDWKNFEDPAPDGSKEHPFVTIAAALDVAAEGNVIHIFPGAYDGGHALDLADLTITGEAAAPPPGEPAPDPVDEVFVTGPTPGAVFTVVADNVTIKDMTLSSAEMGVIFSQVNVGLVKHVHITSMTGKTNHEAAGVYIDNSKGVTVSDTYIAGIKGGYGSDWKVGQEGAGVIVHESHVVTVEWSTLTDITAGQGGYHKEKGGVGAGVISRSNSTTVMLRDVEISDVEGGRGGHSGDGPGHIGAGVYVSGGTGVIVDRTLAYDIRGGVTGKNLSPSAYSACVYGTSMGKVVVNNLTCVGSGIARQRGVWANSSPAVQFTVASSIIANLTDHCLFQHANNFYSGYVATYNTLYGCEAGLASNLLLGPTNILEDPLLVDPANDDYHLLPDSPAIDTGKPVDYYCREPAPNGCRVNMGAYGNTIQATSAPGAETCNCCGNQICEGGIGETPKNCAYDCDSDQDEDGVPIWDDNCPQLASPIVFDFDKDGFGNPCDDDDDNDGIPDDQDICPLLAGPPDEDLDGDGQGDGCDPDADGDEIPNQSDNCPMVENGLQEDLDQDNVGDACDTGLR